MATTSIAQDECTHPPHRTYAWFAHDGTLCAGCCDCGKVLAGAAPEPERPSEAERARTEVERLELALHQLRGTGGRQRERIEVWLQGARVALAIAEREGLTMSTDKLATLAAEVERARDRYERAESYARQRGALSALESEEGQLAWVAWGRANKALDTARAIAQREAE